MDIYICHSSFSLNLLFTTNNIGHTTKELKVFSLDKLAL